MEIRVIKEPVGVLPGLMPEIGRIYEAQKGRSTENGGRGRPFCWIEINGKKIVLREGEYSVVEDDAPKEETVQKEQEKTTAQEAQTATEPPRKRGPKPKTEADIRPEDARLAMLQAELSELLDALTAERAKSSRLERALLALTLEHYGK